MDEKTLRLMLQDLPISKMDYYTETDSTNERALVALGEKLPPPQYSLFIAERQTAGRGRMGRSWVTTPGASLAVTLIILPTKREQERLGLFPLLGALGICRALQDLCGPLAQVKWPNDVLLGGQKTAGVLAESRWEGGILRGIALGMGINVLPESVPHSQELLFPATCVQAHYREKVDTLRVLKAILAELIALRPLLPESEFILDYLRFLAYRGQEVQLSLPNDETATGTLAGINDTGELILRGADGLDTRYPIGDLRLRPA